MTHSVAFYDIAMKSFLFPGFSVSWRLMSKLVAFDVGTSSLKAVLMSAIAGSSHRRMLTMVQSLPCIAKMPDAWWRVAREATRKLDLDNVEARRSDGDNGKSDHRQMENGTPLHSVLSYSNPCGTPCS